MTQEIIKVLGIFAPELLTKYLNARSKKDKVCHFILDYILAHGAVDGISVEVLYGLFGINNRHVMKRWFNSVDLSWWLIYYLLRDYDNCTLADKGQVIKYIHNNEQNINSWFDFVHQSPVQKYLNNTTSIWFWCYLIFLFMYFAVVIPECPLYI